MRRTKPVYKSGGAKDREARLTSEKPSGAQPSARTFAFFAFEALLRMVAEGYAAPLPGGYTGIGKYLNALHSYGCLPVWLKKEGEQLLEILFFLIRLTQLVVTNFVNTVLCPCTSSPTTPAIPALHPCTSSMRPNWREMYTWGHKCRNRYRLLQVSHTRYHGSCIVEVTFRGMFSTTAVVRQGRAEISRTVVTDHLFQCYD